MGIVSLAKADTLGFSCTAVPHALHCTIQSSKIKVLETPYTERIPDFTCKQPVISVLNGPDTMKSREEKFWVKTIFITSNIH